MGFLWECLGAKIWDFTLGSKSLRVAFEEGKMQKGLGSRVL